MNPWLAESMAAIARDAGVDPASLALSDADARSLLDLARIASHTSGDRTNAPLLCYLIGRLVEQAPGTDLASLKNLLPHGSGGPDAPQA